MKQKDPLTNKKRIHVVEAEDAAVVGLFRAHAAGS